MRGWCKRSGIEIEGELIIATRAPRQQLFHSQTGGFAHTMGFEPAFHPDVTALGFPDFSQFEGATTARALKRVVAKTLFDALAPFEMLDGRG